VNPPRSAIQLAEELRALGVGAGDIVMIHASMRRVGPVEGGAASVIDALRAAIGPGGTLLMVLGADEDVPFDALASPVDVEDMGILAEVFRTYPGVSVNDHPADRFAALGPLASLIGRAIGVRQPSVKAQIPYAISIEEPKRPSPSCPNCTTQSRLLSTFGQASSQLWPL